MTVSAHGGRIAVDLNGHRTAELRDDPGASEGRLALQEHAGQDVEIYFKDIEVDESGLTALHYLIRTAGYRADREPSRLAARRR